MLLPKKTKYNKQFKNIKYGTTTRGNQILFGSHGLKTLQEIRLTSKQIEAGRRAIVRQMKRLGFLWIRVFPHIPVTAKPNEVRMGKGKGSVDRWVAPILRGQIIYEISGITDVKAIKVLMSGAQKLPVKTKIVSKMGL
jgi:large subunit ribosomal protein L16